MMICISGFSGTGKDEVATRLIKQHGAIQTGLADPAKRHMADIYDFSYDQLWGPSVSRNAGDVRYMKPIGVAFNLRRVIASDPIPEELRSSTNLEKLWTIKILAPLVQAGTTFWTSDDVATSQKLIHHLLQNVPYVRQEDHLVFFVTEGDPHFWLSPREALQLYCELMNTLYHDTWVKHGIETHRKLGETTLAGSSYSRRYRYARDIGLMDVEAPARLYPIGQPIITCFSDFRHWHEIRGARAAKSESTIPILVRVRRPGIELPPFAHRSETEQVSIPDSEFDFVLNNNGTLEDLHRSVDELVQTVQSSTRRV